MLPLIFQALKAFLADLAAAVTAAVLDTLRRFMAERQP